MAGEGLELGLAELARRVADEAAAEALGAGDADLHVADVDGVGVALEHPDAGAAEQPGDGDRSSPWRSWLPSTASTGSRSATGASSSATTSASAAVPRHVTSPASSSRSARPLEVDEVRRQPSTVRRAQVDVADGRDADHDATLASPSPSASVKNAWAYGDEAVSARTRSQSICSRSGRVSSSRLS